MSMDQLNGIQKWIRLAGFPQLILQPTPPPLSVILLIPRFRLSSLCPSHHCSCHIRAVCSLLPSSCTANNWAGLPEPPDFSSLAPQSKNILKHCRNPFLFVKHIESATRSQTSTSKVEWVYTATATSVWANSEKGSRCFVLAQSSLHSTDDLFISFQKSCELNGWAITSPDLWTLHITRLPKVFCLLCLRFQPRSKWWLTLFH